MRALIFVAVMMFGPAWSMDLSDSVYRTFGGANAYDFSLVKVEKEKKWARKYFVEGTIIDLDGEDALVNMDMGWKAIPQIDPLLMSSGELLTTVGSMRLANSYFDTAIPQK